MSNTTDLSNLVDNEEVFAAAEDSNQPAFPPTPPTLQRPSTFVSPVQPQPAASQEQQPPVGGLSVETPLRDMRVKLARRTEGLRTIILAFGVFSFGLTVALIIELFIGAPPVPPHGGVSSNAESCSSIGVEQLKRGGSAVDAAISVMLCVGVLRPQSAGLGGGGFMIVHEHKVHHNSTLLDFRETAPMRLASGLVQSQEALRKGGLSVGVPGELAGMVKAYKLFGRLPWSDLFAPVIKLAEAGWTLDKKDSLDIQRRWDVLREEDGNYAQFRQTIMAGAGQARMRRTDLAALYRKLAVSPDHAISLFYNGSVAEEIANTVRKAGGVLEGRDLADYSVRMRRPLTAAWRNFKLITFPAPSSGSLLIHMLNEMDSVTEKDQVGTVDYYAKLAEVSTKASKCRGLLGDSENDVGEHEKLLMNKTVNMEDYCRALRIPPEDGGTSHINVIDNNEMIVSITSSLNYWYGSLLMTPSGILLNNQMDDFDVSTSYNDPKPGHRPLSSMVPSILFHESRGCLLRMAIGAVNGTKIPLSIVQTLMNIIVKGDDLPTAVEAPKIYCDATNCRLEDFDKAKELAEGIREKVNLPVTIAGEKISEVGVVSKLNSTVDGYIETSSYGKAIAY